MSRSNPKPRPRPERAIILDKKSVALSQLETAILLWFQHGDCISILMLAFNAHQILQALAQRAGKPPWFKTWLEEQSDATQKRMKYVVNFCKHPWRDINETTPHDPRQAEIFMLFAGLSYREAFGKPTPLIFAFDLRLTAENPSLAIPQLAALNAELRYVHNLAGISRQQFLEENLTLIKQVLA